MQTAAITSYLEPLSALVFSALLVGEKLAPIQIAGAVLILGGAAFGELMGQRAVGGLRESNVPGSAREDWARAR